MPGEDALYIDRSIGGYEPEFYDTMEALEGGFPGIANAFRPDTAEELYGIYRGIQNYSGAVGYRQLEPLLQFISNNAIDVSEEAARPFEPREVSSYDGGFNNALASNWGGYNERPSMDTLDRERRYAYRITDYGAFKQSDAGFEFIEDPEEIQIQRADRKQSILDSMASAKKVYTPMSVQSEFNLSDFARLQRLPNGISRNGVPLYAARVKGRYASNQNRIEFNKELLEESGRNLSELIRKEILKNYDDSTITNRTGTLRRAIEEAVIAPPEVSQDNKVTVGITLASLTRPAQLGRDNPYKTKDKEGNTVEYQSEQVTTDFYGPMVFEGRRAMMPVNVDYLRFFIPYEQVNSGFEGWHTSFNVRASEPHPEVWNLSESNLKTIADSLFMAVVKAFQVVHDGKETQ